MTSQTNLGARPQQQGASLETQPGNLVGHLPEASRLSVLSYLDSRTTLVGDEHLIDACNNSTEKKVAVAICGDKVVVSLGVRAGPYARQHWQLIQEEGSQLHPDAKGWLDPKCHRPREGVFVCATAFKVVCGKVILGGGSLLYESPMESDAAHLTEFLQRSLDSHSLKAQMPANEPPLTPYGNSPE